MIDKVKKPGENDDLALSPEAQALADAYAPKRTAADHDPHAKVNVPPNELTQKSWDNSYHREAWNATPQGRLAIRTFSRGLMGAMFFTAGGLWARKLMAAPEATGLAKELEMYNSEKSFGAILEQKNPLQFIAKTIDTVAGTPIKAAVNLFTGSEAAAMRAVHFKPTKYFKEYTGLNGVKEKMLGRSLGEESVYLTFDFFCASIGDAMGRDIAGWFDPAEKKNWIDEKGHIKWPEAVKQLTNSMFRYVTYNGGEDWAVAIPYVYFVRAQRNCIDKYLSRGYAFESDIALNASSLKMSTGSTPHTVTGSYSLEAIMDYQSRFTAYNIGTLLYRELYDKADQALHGKHINLYGAPDAPVDKNRGIAGNALDTAKWMLRGAVKGLIYMTPAVPFFALTRATQGRERALFIDPNKNAALGFRDKMGEEHYVTVQEMRTGKDGLDRNTPVFYSQYDPKGNDGRGEIHQITHAVDPQIGNPMARNSEFDEYHRRNNIMENAFSKIGETNKRLSRSLDGVATALNNKSFSPSLKRVLGLNQSDNFDRFTRSMVNASVSYTPYMYAKAEFANLWDTGKMDYAVERAIDGVFAGNIKEVKAGIGDTWNAFLHKPFADPVREKEAQRRTAIDTSAADDADPEFWHRQGNVKEAATSAKQSTNLPWTDRIVKGGDGASLKDSVTTKHAPQTHSERENMRKMLEEIQPPTNSIH